MAKAKEKEALVLRLSVQTHPTTGAILAVYFHLRQGKAAVTKEFKNGLACADYDRDGRLLGIELLGPCELRVLDRIARNESKPVKDFLRRHVPRGMTEPVPA